MSRTSKPFPQADRGLSRKAAIVGIGETDYGSDYRSQRQAAPGQCSPTVETLAATAFERALADAGLERDAIDGIAVSFLFGGPDAGTMASSLGIAPRYAIENGGIMAGPLPVVCAAIAAGHADTIAMIYAVATRSTGVRFGGSNIADGQAGVPVSYYYHHPWGWSSQAAHFAMLAARYHHMYGTDEEDLAAVVMQIRRNAVDNPNAIMRSPMSLADYKASRPIVRPLRLFDMCLVNDGAVCLIVRRTDLCRDGRHAPVLIGGWGAARSGADKLRALVRDGLRPQMQAAADQAYAMAGIERDDVGHLEVYDASSIQLVGQVEGYGFAPIGRGLASFASGAVAPGGPLPVNTAGGMLSEANMNGWNHVVEMVRQMRHEAGTRQTPGLRVGMTSLVQTDQAHPIIYQRAA